MKIVTIGLSPCLTTSRSKINSWILQYLYLHKHEVTSIVWGHDQTYFTPDVENSQEKFYHTCQYQNQTIKIPLNLIDTSKDMSISVYEHLEQLKPDVVITIGDISDFAFMKAVKSFATHQFKWLSVMTAYNCPINENYHDLVNDIDGILCTSQHGFDAVKDIFAKELISWQYTGSNTYIYKNNELPREFAVAVCLKNTQTDNLPTILQACHELKQKEIPELKIMLNANVKDRGDYDFSILKSRFDPDGNMIALPDKHISLQEGLSDAEWSNLLNLSDVYISTPMAAATSMSVFQAMACGCIPLISNCGSNKEIAKRVEEMTMKMLNVDDVTVKSTEFMAAGETMLAVPDKDDMKGKLFSLHQRKNKGFRDNLCQFSSKYSHADFLKKVLGMVLNVYNSKEVVVVESV